MTTQKPALDMSVAKRECDLGSLDKHKKRAIGMARAALATLEAQS